MMGDDSERKAVRVETKIEIQTKLKPFSFFFFSFSCIPNFQLKLKVFPVSDFLFETIQLDELGHFSFGGASRKNFMWKAVQNS